MTAPPAGKPETKTYLAQSSPSSSQVISSSGPREGKLSFEGAFQNFVRLGISRACEEISYYLALSEITFEWGDSYDEKDWGRLRAILAPTLHVDYTQINGHRWEAMPADDFVGIMSHVGFIGDPLVHTQHHIGASKWQVLPDGEVIGHHQLRAAHQRYTDRTLQTVENKGHGHAMIRHLYRKVDGQWKLAGLKPTVRWNDLEFERIFKPL